MNETIYEIDADDVIVAVNAAWDESALASNAGCLSQQVLGTSLWAHFHGAEVKAFSKELVERARSRQQTLSLPFRCDTPELRRSLRMEIAPRPDGGVEFRNRLLSSERRVPVPIPLEGQGNPGDLVKVCAWCKRLHTKKGWCELEEALTPLGLFSTTKELRVSHGICPDCLATQRRDLAFASPN